MDLYQDFGISLDDVERVGATADEQQKYAIQSGDCFFTRSSLNLAGIAHCNIIRDVTESALFECHLIRVRPDRTRVVPEYLALWCRSPWSRAYFMARAKQTAMTTIAQPDIAPLPIAVPSLKEQQQIIATFDAHNTRIRTEETYRAKLRALKKGLMADLLTGRVRVDALKETLP